MRVDARHLRRDVGAHAHHPAGELVDDLEGAQLHVVAGPGEQRVHVLEEGRHHQLKLVFKKQIQYQTTKTLDPRSLSRQNIFYVLGKNPLHAQVRAKRRSSKPTSIEDSPTKGIWPSLISVMRRKVSRQRLGARNGSTPSSISIRASAMRKIAPELTRASFSARGAALRVPQVAEEIRARLEQQQVVLAAEARAVRFHAAVEGVKFRVLLESLGVDRRRLSVAFALYALRVAIALG